MMPQAVLPDNMDMHILFFQDKIFIHRFKKNDKHQGESL